MPHPPDTPSVLPYDQLVTDQSDQPLKFGRRAGLKGLLAGVGLFFVGRLANHGTQLHNEAQFMLGREALNPDEIYTPADPEHVLRREASDKIFDDLKLAELYPQTVTKDSFAVIIQRPARIATTFFRPSSKENQEREFETFCELFFKKMMKYADQLKVDFIANLLMFQVSGANTSSVKAQRQDVRDELIRVGMSMGKNIIGFSPVGMAINAMRALNFGEYYGMARLEGPVTLGIHDIEIIMIARGLIDIKNTDPTLWNTVEQELQKHNPAFLAQLDTYVDLYAHYETESDVVTERIQQDSEIQAYLQRFYNPHFIEEILVDNKTVDAYQLSRTTVFWAFASELNQTITSSMYQADKQIVEKLALKKTLEYYLSQNSPSAFFLDQIGNPKLLQFLKIDAGKGNKVAQTLLSFSKNLEQISDAVIFTDRKIATAAVKTEQNLDLQMLTGVAYSKWLLTDAARFTQQSAETVAHFPDSSSLSFTAFLGNLNRESAPSLQLAGTRPLLRATLPFGPPRVLFETMNSFIQEVYSSFEPQHPQDNFRPFARHMLYLLEEIYIPRIAGTHRYRLERDEQRADFITKAETFGAYRNIMSAPHSSSMRALEAVAGYIAEQD